MRRKDQGKFWKFLWLESKNYCNFLTWAISCIILVPNLAIQGVWSYFEVCVKSLFDAGDIHVNLNSGGARETKGIERLCSLCRVDFDNIFVCNLKLEGNWIGKFEEGEDTIKVLGDGGENIIVVYLIWGIRE